MKNHIGDLAELYALGALDANERLAVEVHVEVCSECARALGCAEAFVLSLDAATAERREPPESLLERITTSAKTVTPTPTNVWSSRNPSDFRRLALWTAAVVLLITQSTFFIHDFGLRERMHDNDQALITVARTHFRHMNFIALSPGFPAAKLLYEPKGRWFYILIASSDCACRALIRTASGERDAGAPQATGAASSLFIADAQHATSIRLVRSTDQATLASATLTYGTESPSSPSVNQKIKLR